MEEYENITLNCSAQVENITKELNVTAKNYEECAGLLNRYGIDFVSLLIGKMTDDDKKAEAERIKKAFDTLESRHKVFAREHLAFGNTHQHKLIQTYTD